MVEVRISTYECGKCGKRYSWKGDAQKCCEKTKIEWDMVKEFELKPIHIKLLQRMNVSWDDCEFGAPSIDPKHPYGNSSVIEDIAEIIKFKKKDNYDYNNEEWKEEAWDYMYDLHKQMEVVLQIVLECQTFECGQYERVDYHWRKKNGK